LCIFTELTAQKLLERKMIEENIVEKSGLHKVSLIGFWTLAAAICANPIIHILKHNTPRFTKKSVEEVCPHSYPHALYFTPVGRDNSHSQTRLVSANICPK